MNNNLSIILKREDRTVSFLKRNTNITRYSLDKIVKGEKSPTLNQVEQIANALNVLTSDIFFDFDTNTNNSNSNNKNKTKESGKVK